MKRLLVVSIVCSLLLFSCGENEAIYYQGEVDSSSGVYFAYYSSTTISPGGGITYHYRDTTSDYSLANAKDSVLNVSIPVRLFGEVSEEERPYIVKVLGGTVQEGEDFILPEEFVMKGGKALSYVTVGIKKKDILQDGIVRYITLGLEANDYFKPYIANRIVGSDTVNTQMITIRYSMVFKEPWTWGFFALPSLGAYSHTKLNFLLSVMGWTYAEFTQKNLYSVAPAMALFAQIELQKRADEGNPVRELDGSLMQLAGDYLVDYSAYE